MYTIGVTYVNRKGFVLVETIITSVFVLGLLTFIIANVLPIIGEYEKTNDYDTIESIYDAHLIRKMILKGGSEERIAKLLSLPSGDGKNYYLFDKDDICYFLDNENYCKTLLSREYLDVKEIVITSYEIKDAFVQTSKKFDRGMREYISQMQKYKNYNFANRLIVYFNDGRITNIEILYDGPSGGVTC